MGADRKQHGWKGCQNGAKVNHTASSRARSWICKKRTENGVLITFYDVGDIQKATTSSKKWLGSGNRQQDALQKAFCRPRGRQKQPQGRQVGGQREPRWSKMAQTWAKSGLEGIWNAMRICMRFSSTFGTLRGAATVAGAAPTPTPYLDLLDRVKPICFKPRLKPRFEN